MRNINFIAAVTLGSISLSVLALAGVTVVSAPAEATPAYAAQEKKACGFCHVNAAGGGPRNAAGKKYEANGHKF